jgi:hypothetical protein
MKEYVNEMLIESARKKGRLCASDMTFNATTINNYMALFANKGGISLTEKRLLRLMPVGQQNIHPLEQWLLSSLWPVHISMLLPVTILNGVNFSTHYLMIRKYCTK